MKPITQQELHNELEHLQQSAEQLQWLIKTVKSSNSKTHNPNKVARGIPFLLKVSEKISNELEGLSVSLYIDQKHGG